MEHTFDFSTQKQSWVELWFTQPVSGQLELHGKTLLAPIIIIVCMQVRATVCVWRPQDDSGQSVLALDSCIKSWELNSVHQAGVASLFTS